jgi:hypothetical protein
MTGGSVWYLACSPYDRQDVIEPFAPCAGLLTPHAAWALRDRGASGAGGAMLARLRARRPS